MSLEEWIDELSPHYILTSLGEDLEVLVLESIPPPVLWPEPIFKGRFLRRTRQLLQAAQVVEHCQHQPKHNGLCTANHRISKIHSLRPLFARHMKTLAVSVKRAVISHRVTLEFIFICQNANVNVQKEALSLGAKEADPIMFFFFFFSCPISLLFPFLLGGELFWHDYALSFQHLNSLLPTLACQTASI